MPGKGLLLFLVILILACSSSKKSNSPVTMSISQVDKGGSGSWSKLPMTPNSKLSTEEAHQMAKYIFSLKNK